MAKNKRGHNWKARQVVQTSIDNSKTKKISLDLKGIRTDNYDECNALVIPSDKRKTKKKVENVTIKRILSKKQRKRLEKIVDKRKKKEHRAALLDALAQVQAPPEELKQLISIAHCQTRGLKRLNETDKVNLSVKEQPPKKASHFADSHKRRMLMICSQKMDCSSQDPNIVEFEEPLSSDNSEEEKESENGSPKDEEYQRGTHITTSGEYHEPHDVECLTPGDKHEIENESEITEEKSKDVGSEGNNEDRVSDCWKIKASKKIVPCKPAVFVPVTRPPGVQDARMKLPVLAEEQVIMEAISENDILVLAGETGSGKTTQLPQFLYEAGYAREKLIGVTEPRRVAAISMSQRVGYEMGLNADEVSYLIRYEGNVTDDTKIKFMTDGVLLKEVQTDFLLKKYSVIILDEAHERSVYTDILLGLLSRIVPLRSKRNNPLKMVIMSATLRLEDFVNNSSLFPTPPPIINVESRQFPVTIHFNKYTREDYLSEAYVKVCKIHSKLPDGGILVFMTGQQEVNALVRKLRKAFPFREMTSQCDKKNENKKNKDSEQSIENDILYQKIPKKKGKLEENPLPVIDLDEFPVVAADEGAEDDEMALDGDGADELRALQDPLATRQPLWVLPLYSLLPSYKQTRVFEPPPPGCRLCVVATNVAETSLTIPSVRYVVDCGKEKVRRYDRITGVSAFYITWTSKASANQRAGRAGRVGPGHCYRLYSSAVFNDQFQDFSVPEIQRKPVDDLVLQMKAMGIHKVVNFPFPSHPGLLQLQAAERRLCLLGALLLPEGKATDDWVAKITPLGKSMSAFPVAPRFAKMLALSHQQGLLPHTICMVAALAVPEVMIHKDQHKGVAQIRRTWAGTGNSLLLGDPVVLMRAVGAAEHAGVRGNLSQFCEDHGLRHKAVVEVRKMRLQLTAEVNASVADVDLVVDPSMAPPTEEQARLLRQLLLAGLGDQVAHRVDPDSLKEEEDRIKWKYAYKCGDLEEPVRIHSSSVLRREHPEWVVYQEVFETTDQRMYMRGVTAIEPEWLPLFSPALCNLSAPLPEPPPHYDISTDHILCHVAGTYGRAAWPLPVVEVDLPAGLLRYKWFAVFFLEGLMCSKLQKYKTELLSSPNTMTKSWARLQPRTELLLNAFIEKRVDSKMKLMDAWKNDRSYLLRAYLAWLPESAHNEVTMLWPPV